MSVHFPEGCPNGGPPCHICKMRGSCLQESAERVAQIEQLQADIVEHVDYLTSTLIPDLQESGLEATAVDFAHCCELLGRCKAALGGGPS